MSKIEWTEKVWNPVTGCMKVSPGCENCYAINMANRLQGMPHTQEKYAGTIIKTKGGKVNWSGKINLIDSALTLPLKQTKPSVWFVNSMSDLWHQSVPDDFIDKVIAVAAICEQDIFQILTKRADRAYEYFSSVDRRKKISEAIWDVVAGTEYDDPCLSHIVDDIVNDDSFWPLKNVWIGVSVEDQQRADERIPHLMKTPAAVRWLSCEPLLGPVDLSEVVIDGILFNPLTGVYDLPELPHAPTGRIDWAVAGGESGHGARPVHPDWVRKLRDQCFLNGVPFFFKQWGAYGPTPGILNHKHPYTFEDGTVVYKADKYQNGRLLDGREWNEYPK